MGEDAHGISAAVAHQQIASQAFDENLARGHIQPAQFILCSLRVLQDVAAVARRHQVQIIAVPSLEEVITRTALKHIVPQPAREGVRAGTAEDQVGGGGTRQPVGTGAARDQSLDGQHRTKKQCQGILAAADGSGQGAEDGGTGGAHAGQGGGEAKQGSRIGQRTCVGREGLQQSSHVVSGGAVRLEARLHPPEEGGQLHLGGEEPVDSLPQPREGLLQDGGDPTLRHLGPGHRTEAAAHQLLHGPQAAEGVLITVPAGQHLLLNPGPGEDQRLDQGLPLHGTAGDPLLQQGRQGAIGAGGNRLMQRGHQPHPRQFRQSGDGIGNRKGLELARAGEIHREPHVIAGQQPAIAGAVGAELGVAIALGISPARLAIGEGKTLDPELIETEQLTRFGICVGIIIAPEPEFRPDGIAAINATIAIAIEAAQGFEAMGREGAIAQARVVPEQLVTGGDAAIAIAIPNQQGIAGTHPARALGEAIAVVVEVDGAIGDAPGADTVAVEVEQQG